MQAGSFGARAGRSSREDAVGNRLGIVLACAVWNIQAAEIELEGHRLLVTGMLDGSSMKAFTDHLASGKVRTVVFENSLGGTAEAAGEFARAIRASGVDTEIKGQCHAACAYAFLAGKGHRFGRGFQVHGLLIPVPRGPARRSSPTAGAASKPTGRWRNSSPRRARPVPRPCPRACPRNTGSRTTACFSPPRPHFSAASTTASTATARRGAIPRAAKSCPTPTLTSSAS